MVNNLEQVTKILNSFIAGDSLPQAYLFIGDTAIKSVATEFASKLLDGKFPNVDTVQFNADGEDSSVQAIREVLQVAALKPVQSKYKVVLMEHMELATTQMMNSLLKTLEEPPSHTVFILLSSRALLPTVMSRCQVFNLSGRSEDSEGLPEDIVQGIKLLEQHAKLGIAERMILISELADLEDQVLRQIIREWLHLKTTQLGSTPERFLAVRNIIETLQALEGNFNKKIVLQNFVTTGLI